MIAITAQMSDHEQDRGSLDSVKFDISITLPALPGTHWSETLGDQAIPEASQVTEIRDIINVIDLALADIERYKNHVQHILDQLDLRRAKLAALAFEHKSFLAPIRLLPNELLSEIFEWSCTPLQNDHDFPVSLVLVSRRWKAVGLATPAIWANITIGSYFAGSGWKNASALQCEAWLNRSAHKPLSVSILHPKHIESTEDVPEQLISECARWEYFHYSIGSSDLIQRLRRIQGHLPLLRSLTLQPEHGVMDLEVFEIAPRLREVIIRSWRHGMLKLPFHQLTRLSVAHKINSEMWLECLRLCPNLIAFEADIGMTPAETTINPGTYLTHKCLRALKLYGRVWDAHSPIDKVVLPALQTLDLHDDGTSGYSHVGSIQLIADMVSRSECVITTLRWSSQSERGPIIEYLHAFPHLLNLYVSLDVDCTSPFLERLTSESPCPRLEILDIFVKGKPMFHEEKSRLFQNPHPQAPISGASLDSRALLTFLRAQRAGTHDFGRIRISDAFLGSFEELCGHPEPPEIQALRHAGMVIVFGSKEVSEEHANRGIHY